MSASFKRCCPVLANPSVNRTPGKVRLPVPSAPRAPVAEHRLPQTFGVLRKSDAEEVPHMLRLPPEIAALSTATGGEVHAQSFGLVKTLRELNATGWEQRRGIDHPVGESAEPIDAMPVLPPAAHIESRGGRGLADLHNGLFQSVLSKSLDRLVGDFNRLLDALLPVARIVREWDLEDAESLACGLALAARVVTAEGTCGSCGYLLEGLEVAVCPRCGKRLT
jgi:hypothetical protein